METNRLRQFRTIVETGNLRKAAELLGISHSGLSKSMKTLEMELGIPLFLPSGRGIVVSDQGMRLFAASASLLEDVDRLMGVAKGEKPVSVLRLGSFEVFTTAFIARLLKNYLPETEIEVHELVPGRLEEALVFNKVDVGITYEPIPRKGVEYTKITHIEMGAFALKGKFKDKELAKIPFIVPVQPLEGAASGVKGRDAWPDDKVKRWICYKVDLMNTGIEIARQGLGAIFIPKFVAEYHNETALPNYRLEALELPKTISHLRRAVYIVMRESSKETHELRQIAKGLRGLS